MGALPPLLILAVTTFVEATLHGMSGGHTTEPSTMAPMLGVLGDKSSDSDGEGVGGGNASPPKDAEVDSLDHRHPMVASIVEVSEDEAKTRSPVARFHSIAF